MSQNSSLTPAAVLERLLSAPPAGTKVADLATALAVDAQQMYKLRRILTKLLTAGAIVRITRGHYALSQRSRAEMAEKAAPASQKSTKKKTARNKKADGAVASAPGAGPGAGPDVGPDVGQNVGQGVVQGVTDGAPASDIDDIDPSITGRISVHPAGYGFVAVEDGSDDVFVPAKYRGAALDGDRVSLATWQGYQGTEGKVVAVLSRGRAKLTGTLMKSGRSVYLQPDDPRIATDYGHVPLLDGAPSSQVGQAALVEIARYPTKAIPELFGRVVRILGDPDDPRTELEKIIICADIPNEFPRGAIAQAERTPGELRTEDLADRVDLRDRPFMTIDPETARDFDDALCVEDGPRGEIRVWVAVADVSHYVRTDDALDREAAVRSVSVYLPDRVLSMLPVPLSAGICSLNPDVDRCAMVARLDFNQAGQLLDSDFAAAVIRSHARLDYPGVAAALAGDFRGRRQQYRRWTPALERLARLARILRHKRLERGALELEVPEARVLLDADDPLLVRDIIRAKGSEDVKGAYQLVEEFMIAANEAVGAFFRERELPALWRVHAAPDENRLDDLASVLRSYGVALDVDAARTPRGMKQVLAVLADKPAARALSFLVLRSLTQAVYDTEPRGHFGLASPNYLHFTSPIRRYPDLIVHRLLKAQLHREGKPSGGAARMRMPEPGRLSEIARSVSQHERRAMEAERETVSMYRAYLMRDQLGDELTGTISAVTRYGAFVEMDEPFVEGLIKIDEIGDEIYVHDPQSMRLAGRTTGFTLGLGDRVLAQVTNASVPLRRVDLRLLSVSGKPPPRGYTDESGGRRRRRRRRPGRR